MNNQQFHKGKDCKCNQPNGDKDIIELICPVCGDRFKVNRFIGGKYCGIKCWDKDCIGREL